MKACCRCSNAATYTVNYEPACNRHLADVLWDFLDPGQTRPSTAVPVCLCRENFSGGDAA